MFFLNDSRKNGWNLTGDAINLLNESILVPQAFVRI